MRYLTLLSALFVSSMAIWFSVAGLAAIFSAYATSVVLMGTAIELAKLVAVVWLHKHWNDENIKMLRTGLSTMVLVVMFITSMGIFGYLSKSHVEQTAASGENIAQVQRVESEIARNEAIIVRANERIKGFENNGSGVDSSLQGQIDKEQKRIDSAYDRVKPVIAVQLQIVKDEEARITERTVPYNSEIVAIDKSLSDLQIALNKGEIKKAQGIAGTRPDGQYGSKTIASIKLFRTSKEARRRALLEKIDNIKSAPSITVISARDEIKAIRNSAQGEIAESNKLITRLRSRLGKSKESDIEVLIAEQQEKVRVSNKELDTLTEAKFKFQASHRKMEAEVGPIKYIAEFIYDKKADATLLEKAVTWLIIMIIFVFDPFAVFLLIAAQHEFDKVEPVKEAPELDNHSIETSSSPAIEPEYFPHPHDGSLSHYRGGYQPTTDELNNPPDDDDTIPPELVMPENTLVTEYEVDDIEELEQEIEEAVGQIEPYKDLNELADIAEDMKHSSVSLVKVSSEYINYNGKVYRTEALFHAFPQLMLNFENEVAHGPSLPDSADNGTMFIKTDITPTLLYRFNGFSWDSIDKNLLLFTAYSHNYIQVLIDLLGSGDYNPELLNEFEKKHIEQLLTE